MKFLKRFNEVFDTSIISKVRLPNLTHRGENIEAGDNISILQQDWFEKLLPDIMTIHSCPNIKKLNFDQTLSEPDSTNIEYRLKKNDCTISGDLVQFNYHLNTIKEPGDVIKEGEPSILEFDIHFVNNDSGIKLLVDITYGDHMAYEFSLENGNQINVIHYTGKGSLYDPETHWGFCENTIKDLVKFFNAFNHGINITDLDLNFLDSDRESYKHNQLDKRHLYNDDSDLIRFGNSAKTN